MTRDLATVLWRRGRLSVLLSPRDIWVGVRVGPGAVQVCLVPCVAVRWGRRRKARTVEVIPCADVPYRCDGFDPADWEGDVPDLSRFRFLQEGT